MTIIYRISSNGYNKKKLPYINNHNCLLNASRVFNTCAWHIIVDSLDIEDPAYSTIKNLANNRYGTTVDYVNKGSGAQTFNTALGYALTLPDDQIVYFIENDYLHLQGSIGILEDAFKLGTDYCTLYLHPDKFIPPSLGGNPEVDSDGGYATKLYQGKKSLFFMVNSTTMTFAAKVKTLREDEEILRKFTTGTYPRDYEMFLALRDKGRSLVCPVNSYSTHGEVAWVAPFIDWENI
jgi:hypothetical protein